MSQHLHQQQIRHRFSAAAADYEDASLVQAEVAKQVMALVPAGLQPKRILDVGCGTGRMLTLALARWPDAELVGLDVAEGMAEIARARFSVYPRVSIVVDDAARFDAPPFDLVLSSSSLHWLRPLDAGLAHVASLVRPGGALVAGLMTSATLCELRSARDAVAPHKKSVGHLPTLEQIRAALDALPACRVQQIHERTCVAGYPDAYSLLQRLHVMGVTSGDVSRGELPLNRRELRELIQHYDASFPAPGGGVQATFSVGYLVVERT